MEPKKTPETTGPVKPGDPPAVQTSGGAYITGPVNTGGGTFIGRDQVVINILSTVVGTEEARDIEALPPEPGPPPFQGLQYYGEEDADRFFGRELLTARIIARLHRTRFLAIIGASGSGKSSLVRAGVIPALRRGERLADGGLPPTDSGKWSILTCTPTSHPLEALATILTSAASQVSHINELQEELKRDPRTFSLAARSYLAERQGRHLLLFIDQFEELFTQCRSEVERDAFLANLMDSVAGGDNEWVTVLIALRADFYAQVAKHDSLREIVSQYQEFIGAMSRDEQVRAIDRPLAQGNWKIQEGLIEVILDDIGYEPGALPLLSHALHETWSHRRGRTLTLSAYTEVGGVEGAIAKTAESVFQNLPPEQQPIARMIFLRMAEVGESSQNTRRRAAFSELITRSTDPLVIETVITILADARLVTTGTIQPGDTRVVEVAHEALIREWPTLQGWLEEDREGLLLHQHLTDATSEWLKSGRDPGVLYRGARLRQAGAWAIDHPDFLSLDEQEFLAASQKQAELEARQAKRLAQAKRQQRIFLAVTAVLFVIAAYLAYAFYFNQEPAVMNGLYNIAIAESEEDPRFSQSIANSLIDEIGENANLLVWYDNPELRRQQVSIGEVAGTNPDEVNKAAAALADRLHADLVVFRDPVSSSGDPRAKLTLYLSPDLRFPDQDAQGILDFGCSLLTATEDSAGLERGVPCLHSLTWMIVGMSEARLGHSLEALEAFQKAQSFFPGSALIQFLIGREYLFLVDRESMLEFAREAFEIQAEQAFLRSAELDPAFVRASIGLGSVYFKQARRILAGISDGTRPPTDLDQVDPLVDLSLSAYNRALELSSAGTPGKIPVDSVARLGLGNTSRLKGEVLQQRGENELAIQQYDRSIESINETIPTFQASGQERYLAQAYEYLGSAYQWKAYSLLGMQDYSNGISAYQQALDYFSQCIDQGDETQDLIVKNDIVAGVCKPGFDFVQRQLEDLGGSQG